MHFFNSHIGIQQNSSTRTKEWFSTWSSYDFYFIWEATLGVKRKFWEKGILSKLPGAKEMSYPFELKKSLAWQKPDHYLFCIKAIKRKFEAFSVNPWALIKQFTRINSPDINEYYQEKVNSLCFAITSISSSFFLLLPYRHVVHTDTLFFQLKTSCVSLPQSKRYSLKLCVLTLIMDDLS